MSLVELTRIAPDTYVLRAYGYSSLFVVTSEGVVVVDPIGGPNSGNPALILDSIRTITDQPVRYLIYSHWAPDHGSGGEAFAGTAEFVSTQRAAELMSAANPGSIAAPTITFTDDLTLELGGKSFILHATRNAPDDQYLLFYYPDARVIMGVDFLPVQRLPFQDLPSLHPDWVLDSLQFIDDNFAFDTLVWGHATPTTTFGTREDLRRVRQYFVDLESAIRAARAADLPDNSEAMISSVRAVLAPTYGSWGNFDSWLPLNVAGAIRWWPRP